jgi:hypothetical protein
MDNIQEVKSPVSDEQGAAKYINTTKITLRHSRVTGLLWGVPAPKHIKAGRRVLYRYEELDRWLGQFSEYQNTGESLQDRSA